MSQNSSSELFIQKYRLVVLFILRLIQYENNDSIYLFTVIHSQTYYLNYPLLIPVLFPLFQFLLHRQYYQSPLLRQNLQYLLLCYPVAGRSITTAIWQHLYFLITLNQSNIPINNKILLSLLNASVFTLLFIFNNICAYSA